MREVDPGGRCRRTRVQQEVPTVLRPDHGALPLSSGDDECPYQGLAPFEADETALFFGRAQATRNLLQRLGPRLEKRGSILLVSGASGVGKSSLLRAGLIPALANGLLPVDGSRHWPRLLITPTSTPLRTLAERWTEAYGGSADTVHRRLRDDPKEALSGSLAEGGRLVLVVDQFEELFTVVGDEQERQAYVRALHALADGPPSAAVIVGLRADYWDRCAAYPQFAEAIQDGQVIVEPLTGDDLRLAITGPAAAVDLEIEPGLVETILGELRAGDRYEAGALPLLSQALRNTWDRRESGRLTIRGYEESGRVRDSVRRTADEVLARLPAEDRKTALKLFRRMTLITAGGRVARRRATLKEIHAAASAHTTEERDRVGALLSAFAGRRLLTLDEDTVEIAHDALLNAWPTLRQWIEPDLTAQAVYDRLIDDAAQWDEHHRDPAFLYRGGRLLSVQDSRPRWDRDLASFPPPGPTVDAFVAASAHAVRRAGRRRSLVLAGLAALSVLALIAAFVAINAANDADHQRDLAVSRQLAAQSEVVGDPVTSALLAVAAWRIAPTAEARYRLLAAAARPDRGALTGHTGSVGSLAFSPDGSIIASGSKDGTARLWDAASHRQLGAPITPPRQECGDTGVAVAFSPDGRVLATACSWTTRLWDVATHRQLGAPLAGRETATAVAFAPDGRTLAVANFQGTVRLWDVATRRPRGDALGHASTRVDGDTAINAVAFSSDGKRLATAGADGTARLWDTATGDQLGATFTGHTDEVKDVAISPDGTTLATASTDGTARLWDLATHRPAGAVLNPPGGAALYGVAFSPDGGRLATVDGHGVTLLWDTTDHQQVGTAFDANANDAGRVAFSPGGTFLAVSGGDGEVRLEDVVTHGQLGHTMPGAAVIALSPDGGTLATGTPDGAGVRLWNVAAQRAAGPVVQPPGRVYGVGFGGRTLTTVSAGGVSTWDTASGRPAGSSVYQGSRIGAMRLSPDGRLLAVQRDGAVLFWDVAGHRETGPRIRVPGHTDLVDAMAFSPDGATLAIAGFDRTVRVFDVAARRQIGASLPVASHGFLDALAFSPDGRTLALSANGDTVRLWDLAGRRLVGAALTGHAGGCTAIAFSPDGRTLVTGSADGTVRLWDLATYRQIGTPMTGHTREVTGIAYSPDGTRLATVGDDATARLWNVAPRADPVVAVCAGAGRSLTRAEWERYVPQEKFRRICR